jgi:hypothetical protein
VTTGDRVSIITELTLMKDALWPDLGGSAIDGREDRLAGQDFWLD